MTGRTISHFRVLGELGGGGMGVVYLGEDEELGRKVALKFLSPHLSTDEEANQRFVQEAKAASALNHPNVCTVYEIGHTDEGQTFIAMAHYEGETLKERLERGPLPTEEAAEIARQVAEGLAAAHEQGIIHRDIKPANIFITKRGRAVILDFGLAKLTGSLDLTKSGSTLGTAHYMSPEQIRGEELDHRTDIWSLGVVLYEMLAGKKPFRGEYEQAISYAILNQNHERLTAQTAYVEDIVQGCLKKKPEERTEEAATLARRLQKAAATTDEGVATLSPVSKTPWIVAAGVTVVAVVLALLVPRLASDRGAGGPTVLDGLVVMPFTVRGDESLDYLSEGMVDLLTLALDGVGGRRAVDARLIFSEINRSGTDVNDLVAVRSLVERLDARDFIMGTVMRVGPHVRFAATQYDADGKVVLQADEEVEEGSDDPMPAIDRLAQKLMASYVGEQDQGRLSLAAMTTSSLPALKAYLEGEEALRAGRYRAAVTALERSVSLDSTFALALNQLGSAYGWTNRHNLLREYVLKAAQHADDLPDRFRRLLASQAALFRGDGPQAEKLLRELTLEYPRDALAWGRLGEYYFHFGHLSGVSRFLAKEPLEHAYELDSDNAEALDHLVEIAIIERQFRKADSLIEQSSPAWDRKQLFRSILAAATTTGAPPADSLISISGGFLALLSRAFGVLGPHLAGNEELEFGERIWSARMDDVSLSDWQRRVERTDFTVRHLVRTGRWKEVRENMYLDYPLHELLQLWSVAVSPLGAVLESELGEIRRRIEDEHPSSPDSWSGVFSGQAAVFRSFRLGVLSVRMSDWPEVERQTRFLEEFAATDNAGFAAGFATTLQAFLAKSAGDNTRAYDLASDVMLPVTSAFPSLVLGRALDRHLRAVVLMEEGRYEEANRLWVTLAEPHRLWQVPTYLYRAQCYEAMGDPDRAIALYQLFADLWKDADPELQPMVEEARAGLERLLDAEAREPS